MKQYDYLIVGAGLFGAVFAHEAKKAGKKCLVIALSQSWNHLLSCFPSCLLRTISSPQ